MVKLSLDVEHLFIHGFALAYFVYQPEVLLVLAVIE